MSRWLDFAAQLGGDEEPRANSAVSAVRGPEPPIARPNGTIGTIGTPPLSDDLRSGLIRLRSMAAPRLKRSEVWPVIVADCVRLAAAGWAQQALALGWTPEQLWGVSPAAGGLADLEGLGVWLDGRRIILLDSRSCIVADDARRRSVFNCRSMDGAVLVWNVRGKR